MNNMLAELQKGLRIERALQIVLCACHVDTEGAEHPWLNELGSLLCDPITSDQAEALTAAALKQCAIKDVVSWLGESSEPWRSYIERKRWLLPDETIDRLRERRLQQQRLRAVIDYGLDKLHHGINIERAVQLFLGACNKGDTLYVIEDWVQPYLAELRRLLSDPITADQAEALCDCVFKDCQLKEVLSWLGGPPMPWRAYIDGTRWLAAEETRQHEDSRRDELRIMREEAEWWTRRNSHVEAIRKETGVMLEGDPEFRDRYAKLVREAKNDYVKQAKSCPKCGSAPDELAWFRYSALPSTDPRSCERDGWMTFCEKCYGEVEFFDMTSNEPIARPDEAFPEDPEICPVHICALIRGTARVFPGCLLFGEEVVDAQRWVFPYARSLVMSRLLPSGMTEVRYCPKCRHAEQEWRTRQEVEKRLIETEQTDAEATVTEEDQGGMNLGSVRTPATCSHCGQVLRTASAKQCRHCLMDWHDPANPRKLA